MPLAGKIALVTGASRGIGREIALSIGAAGGSLALVGRSLDDLEETKRLLVPARSHIFHADLRDTAAVSDLYQQVRDELGEIDILVNAAGVWHDENEKFQGPRLIDTQPTQINDVINVGLRASFLLTRLFLPDMIRKRRGKVLQISCGFAGPHEAVGWLHYYVTNKAIEAFTAGLAAEMRIHQIQVNCIAPWFVATEAVRRFFPAESAKALDPRDVANLALYLVSQEADHISGQTIELRSKLDQG
jgi:3-oxoacyl-[acyl-carrier protein] reductase